MATVSFDTQFVVQEKYADAFFDAWEKSVEKPKPVSLSPYVSKDAEERGEELLKEFCCR